MMPTIDTSQKMTLSQLRCTPELLYGCSLNKNLLIKAAMIKPEVIQCPLALREDIQH